MVIIGLRDELKEQTKQKILLQTAIILQENGFIKVSTRAISEACDVSQGTLFLHFKTKNNLLHEILHSNVLSFENALNERCNPHESQTDFIRNFLSTLIEFENILSRTYKDYPYLSDDLQKQINDLETMIKNLFYDNLKQNRSSTITIIDSFVLIDAFMSQIKNYLLEKNVYSSSNSIIRQRRGRITKLYRILFEK